MIYATRKTEGVSTMPDMAARARRKLARLTEMKTYTQAAEPTDLTLRKAARGWLQANLVAAETEGVWDHFPMCELLVDAAGLRMKRCEASRQARRRTRADAAAADFHRNSISLKRLVDEHERELRRRAPTTLETRTPPRTKTTKARNKLDLWLEEAEIEREMDQGPPPHSQSGQNRPTATTAPPTSPTNWPAQLKRWESVEGMRIPITAPPSRQTATRSTNTGLLPTPGQPLRRPSTTPPPTSVRKTATRADLSMPPPPPPKQDNRKTSPILAGGPPL